jgi:hypothetical protein
MYAKTAATMLLLSCIAVCWGFGLAGQGGTRLWVLRDPGEMAEYETSTWAVIETVRVPAEFLKDPDSLQVNRRGQILFCPDPAIQFGNPEQHFPAGKVWLWNGREAASFDRGVTPKPAPEGGKNVSVESTRRWALSADGEQLYVFENEFRTTRNEDGAEVSVATTYHAWQANLAGGSRSQIAVFTFPPCACGTGVCSENCPEGGFWFPDDGVDDFFIVNHWIPGQIDSTYQSSLLYRKSAGKWSPRKLDAALEDILDAAQSGALIIHTLSDGACCGWDNEGSDQTMLTGGGRNIVIFDERQRYANPNYDVTFYTSSAKLSPDASYAAMSIVSTALPGAEIRLSDGGKANPTELARIRRSMTELPGVEVLRLGDPRTPSAWLPHATLAGWLNERELLVIENGNLVAFDAGTGARRKAPIKLTKGSHLFLR